MLCHFGFPNRAILGSDVPPATEFRRRDGDDQVRLSVAETRHFPVKVLLSWKRLDPFLPDLVAIKKRLQSAGGLTRVVFRAVDDNDDFTDLHARDSTKAGPPTSSFSDSRLTWCVHDTIN